MVVENLLEDPKGVENGFNVGGKVKIKPGDFLILLTKDRVGQGTSRRTLFLAFCVSAQGFGQSECPPDDNGGKLAKSGSERLQSCGKLLCVELKLLRGKCPHDLRFDSLPLATKFAYCFRGKVASFRLEAGICESSKIARDIPGRSPRRIFDKER